MKLLNSILLFSLLVFFACMTKEPCDADGIPGVVDIQQEIIDKVPYKDFAELTFVDSLTGDTHIFYGQGWNMSYWFYKDWSVECNDGVNCQKIQQAFLCSTFPYPIHFGMVTILPGAPGQYIEVNMLKYKYYMWYGNMKKVQPKLDSTQIQNLWYYNVNSFDNQHQPQWNTGYRCFYNASYGLIKVQTPGSTLELASMKNP